MAKISRVFQQLFGNSGDQSHFEQFGARAGGSANFTKDPNTIQSLAAFLTGWTAAINPTNNAPFLEDMNGLFLLLFRQIGYLFQEGTPEWDASTSYFIGSIVKKTGTFELYGSLVDNNVGNVLPNQAANGSWTYLNPQSVAPGIISDYGGSAAPFGYLLCDGSVKAQASFPALFSAIGSTWNTGGEGAGNFRLPDLRGLVTAGPGGTLGLSVAQITGNVTHTLTNAELPTSIGVSDPGHNHSITNTGNGGAAYVGASQATIAGAFGGNFLPVAGITGMVANCGSHVTNISVGGGGAAHTIVQPTVGITKIIKT